MSIDHVLKLYSETLRSSYLHYGFWDKPDTIDFDSITIQDIKNAQARYIEHLGNFIPEDVNSILDVGCGIGGNAEFLIKAGYKVETLSPDSFQKSVISEKFNNEVLFHHCKFEKFQSKNVIFFEQKKQKGTADAIKYCLPELETFNGNVLILSGDVPLIKPETLMQLIDTHESNNALASLISADLIDPSGYGRIIKNEKNQLIKIVEHKDASEKEKKINEINSGIYIFNSN